MSLSRIVSGNRIPERLNREILRCKLPVVCVSSNVLTPETMRCGDRVNAEGIALCDHHNALVMEHQVLVHYDVESSDDDCVVAIKQIEKPEEDSNNCAILGRFVLEHKLVFGLAALTLTGVIGLLARYCSPELSGDFNDFLDNGTENTYGKTNGSWIGDSSVEGRSNETFSNNVTQSQPVAQNHKGMMLRERFKLTVGEEPKLESCSITNENDKDVLAFTSADDSKRKLNVLPKQTVSCIKDNSGSYHTKGWVTRPFNQTEARVRSKSQSVPVRTFESDVFISAEKEALVGETLQPKRCHIVNDGSEILKFKLDSGKHIRVMPESGTVCDKLDPNVPKGKLLNPHIRDFPVQSFHVLDSSHGNIYIEFDKGVATQDKGFIFDDKYYREPISTSDNILVFNFQSTMPQPKTLRIVDKSRL